MTKFYSYLLSLLILFSFAASAQAACINPVGDHGDMLYNRDHTVMQYCNGTDWISMDASHSGGDNLGNHIATKDLDLANFKATNAAIPTASADLTNKAYVDAAVAAAAGSGGGEAVTPNGRYAIACGMYSSIFVCARMDTLTGEATCRQGNYNNTADVWGDCSPSGELFSALGNNGSGIDANGIQQGGFFVATAQTYNGNLGGLAGADAKCLTELQAHPWKGKGSAGTLTAGRVKAFICSASTCNNLKPYTRYSFAKTRSVGSGGASFTTTADGTGPDDANSWHSSNYFGSNFEWWSNRAAGSATLWGTDALMTNNADVCTGWTAAGSTRTYTGSTGITDQRRWMSGNRVCSASYSLICFVNPVTE